MDVDREDNGDSDLGRKANDVARLAFFCEHKRTPLRRDDITKKVLGANASRAFNGVFLAAQEKLRKVFDMELVWSLSRSPHAPGWIKITIPMVTRKSLLRPVEPRVSKINR